MLKQTAFSLPEENAFRLLFILFVVFLASVSEALGQSAVLFFNRVKAHRFFAAILSSALIYVVNFFFWVLSIALIVHWLLKIEFDTRYLIFYIVALAYVPRLFGFLVFSPLLGSVLNIALKIWGLLILHKALVLTLGVADKQAVLIVLFGFIVTIIIRHSFGHPLIALARALTKRTAGVDLELNPTAISQDLEQESDELLKRKRRGQSEL